MIVKEVQAKSILSPSQVYDYVVNAYTGCQHGCSYCYARFMKRFTGHKEPWGDFVDVKTNAPDLLEREITRKKVGTVWVSGMCDPYQPLEAKYQLTRKCLTVLSRYSWPVVVQTRSPLVLRDMDIFRGRRNFDVGLSITTADEKIAGLFEPNAPSIKDRINAIEELHRAGVRTYVMVAPLLPGAEGLGALLSGKVDYLLLDRMNYNHADWIYKKYGLEDKLRDEFFNRTSQELTSAIMGSKKISPQSRRD